MKAYVVFVHYGIEGWRIWGESDDFQDAVKLREDIMSMGNSEVVIMRPVKLIISEEQL